MKIFCWAILALLLATVVFQSTDLRAQPRDTVDLILPAENATLSELARQIAAGGDYRVNIYQRSLPEAVKRGNILLVVSDSLLPLLTTGGYEASFALYVNSAHYAALAPSLSNSSAVFSDQPMARQLALITAMFGDQDIRLGMAYVDHFYPRSLRLAAEPMPQIKLDTRHIVQQNTIQTISQLIQHNQVLLATPEESLYNPKTIRGILLSAYRHRTPVIGPSEGFVNAGALASVISLPEHYTAEAIAMIKAFQHTGTLPRPRPPSAFQVKLNHSVARSLGLVLPSEEEILAKMAEQ